MYNGIINPMQLLHDYQYVYYQGYIIKYHKQQKFRGTRLSRFTGFYQNVGKTFAFLLQL